jgi:peptide/nickel transport system permease protein
MEGDGRRSDERSKVGFLENRERSLALRRFRRNKMALVGGAILLLSALFALAAPLLAPYGPLEMDLDYRITGPSARHLLGSDMFGRDVLSRVLFGSRISIVVGLSAILWSGLVGIPAGLIAGYSGGLIGNVIMRIMDALLSFPPLLLAIAIAGTMGGGQSSVIFALGFIYVPVFARLVRGRTLSLSEEVFVMSAKSYGASAARILVRHILPNVVGVIVVQATIGFSGAILSEATLSFLGLGVPPPLPSWGRDLNDGRPFIRDAWWLIVIPAVTIIVNVLGINFLGDGLRDALDPRTRRRT